MSSSEQILFKYFRANQNVANKLLKANNVTCQIDLFDHVLDIKHLAPEDYSHFDYSLTATTYKVLKTQPEIIQINEQELGELRFLSIEIEPVLTLNLFNFLCRLLNSRKTKLNLSSVRICFSKLSECLNALSHCTDCPELNFINFIYSKVDMENEHEAIEQAKRRFRYQFRIIKRLVIRSNLCSEFDS